MPETHRQLAAVMFTDIKGYTALMQVDETAGREARTRHRHAVVRAVTQHGGEVIQHMGDGALSLFGNAVDAVSAAVAIQVDLREEPVLPVRIGVHTGDVTRDETGIVGDCVNVASRLERLASAGGVLISERVYEEIKNQRHLSAVYLEQVELKNVLRPVRVWAVNNPGLTVPTPAQVVGRAVGAGAYPSELPAVESPSTLQPAQPGQTRPLFAPRMVGAVIGAAALATLFWAGKGLLDRGASSRDATVGMSRLSVAVSPFKGLGTAANDSFFVNGIRQQVQDRLAQLDGVDVVSPNPPSDSDDFRVDLAELGDGAGTSHVLEGEVSRGDGVIRTRASLLDPRTREVLWAEEFESDTTVAALQSMQGRIATQVAEALDAEVSPAERQRLTARETSSRAAYDAYMKGRFFMGGPRSLAELDSAVSAFEAAVRFDPAYARAYAALAHAYVLLPKYHGVMLSPIVENSRAYLDLANEAATTALQLDETLSEAHTALGWVKLRQRYDWAAAEASLQRALQLDGDNVNGHLWYSQLLAFQGRWVESIREAERATELDPQSVLAWVNLADAHRRARDFNAAIARYESAVERNAFHPEALRGLANARLWAGDYEGAADAMARYVGVTGGDPQDGALLVGMIREWRVNGRSLPVPDEASSDPRFTAGTIAWINAATGNLDRALDWLTRAYVAGDQELLVLGIDPAYDELASREEFQTLLLEVGLGVTPDSR